MRAEWIDKVLAKSARIVHYDNTQLSNATFVVLNEQIFGFSVAEVKKILKRDLDIKCIFHSKENFLEAVKESTQLYKNDLIVVSAFENDFAAIEALIGRLQRQ